MMQASPSLPELTITTKITQIVCLMVERLMCFRYLQAVQVPPSRMQGLLQ